MGLTSWHGDAVRRSDVTVAKNYLSAAEIAELNRIVVMFLDYAEDQAGRRKQVFLRDWETKLDDFLRFNERPVRSGTGRISRKRAQQKAEGEYHAFAVRRREIAEAQGEADRLRALEAVAKLLPGR